MKKRGINQIEILLSFLIFIGFVVFALYFFSPFQTSRLVDSSLDYAFREITKNTTIEIESYSVKMDINGLNEAKISDSDFGFSSFGNRQVIINDKNGVLIDSTIQNNNILFFNSGLIYAPDPANAFATFMFSEDFNAGTFGTGGAFVNSISIISLDRIKVLSEKRFIALNLSYYSDYAAVKTDFNLPSRTNFEFTLKFDSTDLIEAKKSIPQGVEIFASSKRVEVMRLDGTTKFADLIIKVW